MFLLCGGKGEVEKFDGPPSNKFLPSKNILFFVPIPTRAYFLQSEPGIGIKKKSESDLCTRAGTRNGIPIPSVKWIEIPGRSPIERRGFFY